jgi:predicted PurR-regulated permease PerM
MDNFLSNLPKYLKSESSKITVVIFLVGISILGLIKNSVLGYILIYIGLFLSIFLFIYFLINDFFKDKINNALDSIKDFVEKINQDNKRWKEDHDSLNKQVLESQKFVVNSLQSTLSMYDAIISEKTTQTGTESSNRKYDENLSDITMK